MMRRGGAAVTWRGAVLLAAAVGVPTAAQEVRVNEEWLYSQTFGRIAAAPDGTFRAVWESRDEFCPGTTDVVMRHIDGDGRFLTGNTVVPSGCGIGLGDKDIAVLDTGRFLVVFNEGFSGASWITGRLFAPDGAALGPDFPINDPTGDGVGSPRVAALTGSSAT